jgi:hypothetical protein
MLYFWKDANLVHDVALMVNGAVLSIQLDVANNDLRMSSFNLIKKCDSNAMLIGREDSV